VTDTDVSQLSQPGTFPIRWPRCCAMARGRFWRRLSRQRYRACSATTMTSSPITALGLVRRGHPPEREVITSTGPVAVRCPRVRHRTDAPIARVNRA